MYRGGYYALGNNDNANTPDNFGNGESYGGVAYGADSNGDPVTFAFDGSGGTYVSSSHVESPNDFFWGVSCWWCKRTRPFSGWWFFGFW